MGEAVPVLSVRGVSRAFGPVQALCEVSLDVYAGAVTALVGDNGAGKSTLVGVITGWDRPDEGEIRLEGTGVSFRDPHHALDLGVAAVYQDLALAAHLDVPANLFLGRELRKRGLLGSVLRLVDRREMRRRAGEAIRDLRIDIPFLGNALKAYSGGQRQAVALARAVLWARRVIVLDEPTAALGVVESARVLELIKRVRAKGLGVLLVSHSMPEVLEVADRITVLRQGRKVADLAAADTSMTEIVGYMTGAVAGEAR